MSEVEAAWLRLALVDLASDVARRRAIVGRYREAAPRLCWQTADANHAYHLAVFRSADRVATALRWSVMASPRAVHYPLAIPQQPAYRDYTHASCRQSEGWAAECISVPCFPEMTEAEVDRVCTALAGLAE